MQSTKVNIKKLIEKLRANRESHRKTFAEARAQYVLEATQLLADRYNDASRTGKIDLDFSSLIQPVSYVSNYDLILSMLEMSIEEDVVLSQSDFNRYVMDNWEWKHSFETSTMGYLGKK